MPGKFLAAMLAALALSGAACAQTVPRAFPTAEGFGKATAGGRGGAVIQVTNLNDSGAGSFRACVASAGPRTCVFRVAGTINLLTAVRVANPFLTVAGQTAPGGGVALRIAPGATLGRTPLLIKGTHDVVVRHVRVRPGPNPDPSEAARAGTDAVTVEKAQRVILDHVSMSWAPDENFNAHGAVTDLTVQWSILAEGLWDHSKAILACSTGTGCGRHTFHHNLLTNHRDRNPQLSSDPNAGPSEFVNNVVHNPYSEFMEIWGNYGGGDYRVVGNTFRRGPSSASGIPAIEYHDLGATGNPRVHASGNDLGSGMALFGPGVPAAFRSATPPRTPAIAAEPAADAHAKVLARAGAWPRDSVDARQVADARNATGRKVRDPSTVGGWPALASGVPYPDADRDGMEDNWELSRGLNPAGAADRNGDPDGDGYTNLEEYLNALAGDQPF